MSVNYYTCYSFYKVISIIDTIRNQFEMLEIPFTINNYDIVIDYYDGKIKLYTYI